MARTNEDALDKARRIFQHSEADVSVRIFRYDMRYLGRIDGWDPKLHDETYIRERFGSGHFQLRFKPRGKPRQGFSKTIYL